MARTTKQKRTGKVAPHSSKKPSAALEASPPPDLLEALCRGTIEEKVALLKEIGILDEDGNLAKKYRSWGNTVSHTF